MSSLTMVLVVASAIFIHLQSSGPTVRQPLSRYANIRQVGFKNFTYALSNGSVISMRGGIGKDGEDEVSVDQIGYGDLTGDRREDAVVLLGGRIAGSNAYYTVSVIVFTLEAGRLRVLTNLEGGDVRGSGGAILDPIRIRNGVISIGRHTGSRYTQVYIETRKYRWNGSQLVEIGKPTKRLYE